MGLISKLLGQASDLTPEQARQELEVFSFRTNP